MSNKIKDPRDGRKQLEMIAQQNMLGRDVTAWLGRDRKVSVYRSTDDPQSGRWIHELEKNNYSDYMGF